MKPYNYIISSCKYWDHPINTQPCGPISIYWNVALTFFYIRTQNKRVWSEEDKMFERSEIKLSAMIIILACCMKIFPSKSINY